MKKNNNNKIEVLLSFLSKGKKWKYDAINEQLMLKKKRKTELTFLWVICTTESSFKQSFLSFVVDLYMCLSYVAFGWNKLRSLTFQRVISRHQQLEQIIIWCICIWVWEDFAGTWQKKKWHPICFRHKVIIVNIKSSTP